MPRFLGLCLAITLTAGVAKAGQTRCWLDHGAVVVPAAFGDIAGDFVLDLAAVRSQLHATRAESEGVLEPVARGDLRIAGTITRGFPLQVADLDQRTASFTTNIAGVLGADLADRFVIVLRFAPCRVEIHPPGWRGSHGALRVAVRWIDGVPVIRAAISDGSTARSGDFAINTGAGPMGIANARFSRPPPAGGAAVGRLRALSFAGRLFEQTPATLTADLPAAVQGSLGANVWSNFRMRLDLRAGKLELTPERR